MRGMEITARELRDIEIREAFRGYHRDDVNDLLERAATTIDAANDKLRQMSERLSNAQADSATSRETEDILHRTLLLAQRAADEAVAEAQAKARQMVDEAETHARRTIAEAESEARVRGESERRRLEQEVLDLAQRRDALNADIDMLSRYETDYRARLLGALETDLETLRSRAVVSPGPRPETHEVEIPAFNERVLQRDDAGPPTREIDVRALMQDQQAPANEPVPAPAGPAAPAANGSTNGSSRVATSAPRAQVVTETRRAEHVEVEVRAPETNTEETHDEQPAPIDLLAAESAMDAEVLDDEAFFATLREAVHDDAPLGPREEDQSSLFDQDDDDDEAGAFKDVFRRRR
jgi:cell division septum initiation protein DivIVA